MDYATDGKKVETLLRRRFFIAPSAQIYGGVSGLYDYGPPGCALKNAMADLWRSEFVKEESLFEMDTSILLPYEVLKASGHVDKFSDLLVFDQETGEFYRADHVIKKRLEERTSTDEVKEALERLEGLTLKGCEDIIGRLKVKSDKGNDLVGATEFNLIFKTSIGPKSQNASFLRPETAQGQFLNFKRLYDMNYERLPFGSATIGRVFRNEISPRSGLLRVREFDQAEVEYFVDPRDKTHPKFKTLAEMSMTLKFESDAENGKGECVVMQLGDAVRKGIINNETLGYFVGKTYLFLKKVGIKDDYLRFRQHKKDEMAHYACDCWDAEILTSYGWIECVGIADRSCYDLQMHQQFSKTSLCAKRMLETPKMITRYEAVIDKKKLGRELKKDLPDFVQHVEDVLRAKGGVPSDMSEQSTPMDFTYKEKTYTLEVIVQHEKLSTEEFIPHIIEPSFGLGRILYSLCEHVYWQRDEERGVLSFPPSIAPVQCEVSFLLKDERLTEVAEDVSRRLKEFRTTLNRRNVSIGKKYSVADEIGVPYYFTVDFDTLKDSKVTIRERDSTEQVRLEIDRVRDAVQFLLNCSQWSLFKSSF